jgi:hypothetical protein
MWLKHQDGDKASDPKDQLQRKSIKICGELLHATQSTKKVPARKCGFRTPNSAIIQFCCVIYEQKSVRL